MQFEHGAKIGHYQVVGKLGEGGMGVVWEALDTRLDRSVAIKVLPEGIESDTGRVERFNREAKLLASLNHPHIAGLHGLEEQDGRRFLVMELVPGQDLSVRLSQGPLATEDALELAGQVADALEAAHESGVIHRDLKPANILVTDDGQAKVLDFGLAKAFDVDGMSSGGSMSPTLTTPATQAGVILGTAAYMSPEQAKGRAVDRRADVWSFGCVLYEMLSGKRAFYGENTSEVLAAVLRDEPDWPALPASLPPSLEVLIRRCLRKDPRQRLRDIGDARIAIEEMRSGTGEALKREKIKEAPSFPWLWLGVAVMAGIAAGAWFLGPYLSGFSDAPADKVLGSTLSLSVVFPAEDLMHLTGTNLYTQSGFALSPSGDRLVYVSPTDPDVLTPPDLMSLQSGDHLVVRNLEDFKLTPLRGTEGAANPVFSPDGLFIAYLSESGLYKVAVSGGAPVLLTNTGGAMGVTWEQDDFLVFTQGAAGGVWFISADGTGLRQVSFPDKDAGEVSHRWPQVLPGGAHVLVTVKKQSITSFDDASLHVVSLETGKSQQVLQGGTFGRYVETGHIIYGRDGALYAINFDLATLQPSGTPFLVQEDVLTSSINGVAQFDVSRAGHLAFLEGGVFNTNGVFSMLQRDGSHETLPLPPDNYQTGVISPDGTQAAIVISTANDKLWLYDFNLETLTPLTGGLANDFRPVWHPDGKSIVFSNDRSGSSNIYSIRLDGSSPMSPLRESGTNEFPSAFSPDGRFLAYDAWSSETGQDIWVMNMSGEKEPELVLGTSHHEALPCFSPDGRWLVYQSDESGQNEIYVQPYPGPGRRIRISSSGGTNPRWSADGREIFYRLRGQFLSVPVTLAPEFTVSKPVTLYEDLGAFDRGYGETPDGESFLVLDFDPELGLRRHLNLVLNWRQKMANR